MYISRALGFVASKAAARVQPNVARYAATQGIFFCNFKITSTFNTNV